MTTTITPTASRRRVRAVGVAGAVLAATAVWLIADPLLGNRLAVETWNGNGPTTVELSHVVITSLIASLAGWAMLAGLERITVRARRIWALTASLFLLLSITGPAGSSTTGATAVALVLMHLAVGAVLIATFVRSAK